MNTNPLGFLIDIIPEKQRKLVYAIISLLLYVFAIWQAAKGDWSIFLGSLVTAVTTTTAAANTGVKDPDLDEAGTITDVDHSATYEDLGGQPYDVNPADAESDVPENTPLYESGEAQGTVPGNSVAPPVGGSSNVVSGNGWDADVPADALPGPTTPTLPDNVAVETDDR